LNADELRASRERFLELARDFVPYGVAERDGLLFVVPDAHGRRTGARKARLDTAGDEEVEVARLDDVVEDEVDFLLVDAEGHEVQVLPGGRRVLSTGVALVLELNPKLLELAGRVDELPGLLAQHYTHVLDLRDREGGFLPVAAVAGLAEEYEGRSTDLLACRLPQERRVTRLATLSPRG
jgi:Methyltransferase FkbM domain